jgi:membrane peptidoglycan carboxypeptidase
VQAERQPGSSFKLFDYYAALRHGFGLDDQIEDTPVDIRGWRAGLSQPDRDAG